jgi:hypothetical protein
MSAVNRVLGAVAVAFLALVPLTSSAAPSPSPSLDGVLAAPPAGFTEMSSSIYHGHFTADEYVSDADASKRQQILDTLKRDGFVDGYGKTWVSRAQQHVLIEVTLAFTGGRGARSWLTAAEAADKEESTYRHADTIGGIEPYYGAHLVNTATPAYLDAFAFVKGNDVFGVAVVSTKDDALAQATSQTRAQFDSAPSETIPSAQWPENVAAGGHSAAYWVGFLMIPVLFLVIVAGLAAFFIARSRRPAAVATPIAGQLQMSPDGSYWWDGQTWRDAASQMPPFAQRSSDGTLWWDGRTWRPVPPPPA